MTIALSLNAIASPYSSECSVLGLGFFPAATVAMLGDDDAPGGGSQHSSFTTGRVFHARIFSTQIHAEMAPSSTRGC